MRYSIVFLPFLVGGCSLEKAIEITSDAVTAAGEQAAETGAAIAEAAKDVVEGGGGAAIGVLVATAVAFVAGVVVKVIRKRSGYKK